MSENVQHNCGVAAIYLKKPLSEYPLGGSAYYLQLMLQHMQNRGRLSAGVVTCSDNPYSGLRRHVEPGLVHQLFRLSQYEQYSSLMNSLSSSIGIGHVRYATSGNGIEDRIILEEAQPFLRSHGKPWKEFAFAYNGNLTNSPSLAHELITNHHYTVKTKVDTELMMHFFAIDLKNFKKGIGLSIHATDYRNINKVAKAFFDKPQHQSFILWKSTPKIVVHAFDN